MNCNNSLLSILIFTQLGENEMAENQEILKTSEEYVKALKKMDPCIIKDKLLDKPFEDEDIQKGLNVVALSYDYAKEEKNKEIMTVKSPFTNKVIN